MCIEFPLPIPPGASRSSGLRRGEHQAVLSVDRPPGRSPVRLRSSDPTGKIRQQVCGAPNQKDAWEAEQPGVGGNVRIF